MRDIDRLIIYAGMIPLESDVLYPQRFAMQALGVLMRATLGDGPTLDGFECTPGIGPQVLVAPGMIAQLAAVDGYPFGVLPASPVPLVKAGISIGQTALGVPAPPAAGQQVAHLIQVRIVEADEAPLVLPFYDAGDPAVPFSGAFNSGQALNTMRTVRAEVAVKLGVPAAAGTQAVPDPDAGWVGAYVVKMATGDAAVPLAAIMHHPRAPFVFVKLPQARPLRDLRAFAASASWTVPPGVYSLYLTCIGGGGPGGHGYTGAGGGGSAGGGFRGYVAVHPGDVLDIQIGAAGMSGTLSGGVSVGRSGGGDTIVRINGVEIGRAPGGGAAAGGGPNMGGGGSVAFGQGSSIFPSINGTFGESGQNGAATSSLLHSGAGGSIYEFNGGMAQVVATPGDAAGNGGQPGSGGSGGVGNGLGGNGGGGLLVVEF